MAPEISNAWLYITAAYLIGGLSMVGFFFWVCYDRQRLRRLITAVKQGERNE